MSATHEITQTTHPPQPAPGQPIPIPPDFPVKWANPNQARMLWELDRMHFPDPVLPFVASLSNEIIAVPFNRVVAQYALPVRLSTLCVNTYLYLSFTPVGLPPDFVLKTMNALGRVAPGVVNALQGKAVAAIVQKYMAQLEPVIERLGDYWDNDWLPELREHLAYWENFDLAGATLPQLISHLDESLKRLARVWEIHFQIILPSFLALNLFDELYRDLFGHDDSFGAFRLLQGFDNKYLEADRTLWQLSRLALTLPTVSQALETCATAEVIPTLEKSPEGHIFLLELQVYLDEYGQCSHKADGLSAVSWIEDPTPLITNLKDYLTQPDRDLETELRAQVVAREELVAQAREQLQGYPQPVTNRFETLLKAAQVATMLHEEHNYWIDQRCQYQVRRVMQEVGQRLARAGVLDQSDEVFYLSVGEVRETAANLPDLDRGVSQILGEVRQADSLSYKDRRTLVRERQAELEHFRAIQAPPAIGAMPLAEPPDDPFGRSFGRVMGTPVQPSAERHVLSGHAGSPGVTRGPAKVIRTLSEASKLQKGDVLVAEATMPSWTPLFVTAAAVTDVGGILSHCAVVAREYHIPAVVGTGTATATIRDGQMLEVDGNAGIVRILDGFNGQTLPLA